MTQEILHKDVVIAGGGISGLSAAYTLVKGGMAFDKLLVLETQNRLGGTIRTDHRQGCLLDAGPDSFVSSKPWALELCHELGLESELIAPSPQAGRIFLARGGDLHAMPNGMHLGIPTRLPEFLLSLLPLSVKLRVLRDLAFKPKKIAADCTIADFFGRHFGQEAVHLLIEPILAGIYAAKAERLSLQATFPQFLALEERYGSIIRGVQSEKKAAGQNGRPVFYSLRQGMGQLIEALADALPAEIIKRLSTIERIAFKKEHVEIQTREGQTLLTRYLILATPLVETRRLLGHEPNLARPLAGFATASTATVFLAFPSKAIKRKFQGSGFLVPRNPNQALMACTWISSKFPSRSPESLFLLRCFIGGPDHEACLEKTDEELIHFAKSEVKQLMGIHTEAVLSQVYFWPERNPQYSLGQVAQVQELMRELQAFPRLRIIGNAFQGVGIPDCIHLARETAGEILPLVSAGEVAVKSASNA